MEKKEGKFKYDLVAEQILDMISDYNPGDKLPSESVLTQTFHVSRVTLRESLKKLNMMGVVTIVQGDGTYVNEIKPSLFMQPLFPLMAFKKSNIKEIYEARMYIEGGACELAAQRRTEEDVKKLQALIDNLISSARSHDITSYNHYDKEFHLLIEEFSGNETLRTLYEMFQNFISGYVGEINRDAENIKSSILDHQQIFQAICEQRTEYARVMMCEHLRKSMNILLKRFG